MKNTIKCKYCGKEIEITEALRHEYEEQVRSEERKRFESEKKELQKEAKESATKRVQEQFELEIKNLRREKDEEKGRSIKLIKQLENLNEEIRKLRRKDEERELEMKRKLIEKREEVKKEVLEQRDEEYRLKELDMKQKLDAALKMNDELKRKLEQGSQQTQGETLEIDLEEILKEAFPNDEIKPVGKGVKGADVKQTVKSPSRKTLCGIILWESKRRKNWSDKWIAKLKEDARKVEANASALVSTVLPEDINGMGYRKGVWVTNRQLVIPLAMLLREALIKVAYQKTSQSHQGRKADLIYEYITSHQFKQQVDAVIEVYSEMQEQVQKERIAFEKQWKQREGQLARMIMATANIYGSMQGLAGSTALPRIKGLELPEIESGNS